MKVSIGTNIKNGPWGGGNLFAINLRDYLISQGHEITYSLKDRDIDVIVLSEPRKTSESSAFTDIEVEKYLKYLNPSALVLHRINECDERKGTNYVNKFLIRANEISDCTVFVSSWLRDLFIEQGIKDRNINVILAGANKKIFNTKDKAKWIPGQKLQIVTHHWGANWNKGFDTYQELDTLLDDSYYNEKFSFTYIGNLPKNFKFKNTSHIKPLSGVALSKELQKYNIYLTASLYEPSGNHHIEGAQCGLPLLYIDSGGIPEYCEGFGIKFSDLNFKNKLEEMYDNYKIYSDKIVDYPGDSIKMSSEYEKLFKEMIINKEKLLQNRKFKIKENKLNKLIYKLERRFKKLD